MAIFRQVGHTNVRAVPVSIGSARESGLGAQSAKAVSCANHDGQFSTFLTDW